METDKHRLQMNLLIDTLKPELAERRQSAYVTGNSFLYYRPSLQGKPPRFVGPDFYVVLDQTPEDRPCYVVWEEEGKLPHVIIELTSKSTEKIDRGSKFILYRDVFRAPEYFIFDPIRESLSGFALVTDDYVPLSPDPRGVWQCKTLGLTLAIENGWLRWFRPDGKKLLTEGEKRVRAEEIAEQEAERADEAVARAKQLAVRADEADARAALLAEKLRSLGIDPEA